MKKRLHIFTAYYPSSKFEVYLDNELKYAGSHFEKMIFYPGKWNEETRELKSNQSVVKLPSEKENSIFLFWKYIDQIFKLFIFEIRFRGYKKVLKNKSFLFHYIFSQIRNVEFLRKKLKSCRYDTYYSNWSVDGSICLALLKEYDIIETFVMRSHRYDLYDYEFPIGFVPFRKYQQQLVNWIGCISVDGCNYLKSQFPEIQHKIKLFRLGTIDQGISPISGDGIIRIVSCSNIKKVKRLHLIAEALKNCKREIEWHHFGDGELSDEIHTKCQHLPPNIRVFFNGRIPSHELYTFFKSHFVSCFVNVSASEGIPVSIMEAISFSIPVIATNVGGTNEIVNEKTGILLDPDFEIMLLANLIDNIGSSGFLSVEFRKGVRAFWEENYNGDKCFPEFIDRLART